jgi:hypothetical protein
MRTSFRIAVAAAFIAFVTSAPSMRASSEADYHYTYYDSSLNEVGHYESDCDNQETSDGTLAGEWLQVEAISCTTPGDSFTYYHYCNGGWHPVAYVGDTSC